MAAALQAWVHLQQYTAHRDLRMLAQAKAHLCKYADATHAGKSTPSPPQQHLLDSDNLSGRANGATPGTAAAAAATAKHGSQIREAIRGELLRKASDVFAECSPEQVPHVFDMVLFASNMGQEERQAQLHHMFVSSVDLEVDRCWESANKHQETQGSGQQARQNGRARAGSEDSAAGAMSLFLLTLQVRSPCAISLCISSCCLPSRAMAARQPIQL